MYALKLDRTKKGEWRIGLVCASIRNMKSIQNFTDDKMINTKIDRRLYKRTKDLPLFIWLNRNDKVDHVVDDQGRYFRCNAYLRSIFEKVIKESRFDFFVI